MESEILCNFAIVQLTPRCVLQVKFSADGNFLYTGARQDPDIFCWDVRYTSDVVYRLQRDTANTNQRVHFDIEPMGRHLTTGGLCWGLSTCCMTPRHSAPMVASHIAGMICGHLLLTHIPLRIHSSRCTGSSRFFGVCLDAMHWRHRMQLTISYI